MKEKTDIKNKKDNTKSQLQGLKVTELQAILKKLGAKDIC